ncbi:MAG TPA: hypothetical protein PLY93_03945 [Turneriella sp.]|nr:hypothetical protein [Turneriella sp.]
MTDSILNKAPSADLWQGQSDEGELGFSYNAADHILYFYIEEKKPLDELKKMAAELGEKESTVDTILSRIERFRFKRQLPPIVALT